MNSYSDTYTASDILDRVDVKVYGLGASLESYEASDSMDIVLSNGQRFRITVQEIPSL